MIEVSVTLVVSPKNPPPQLYSVIQLKYYCYNLQTFFQENSAEEKELSVLKRLKDGHFSHENLCAVLDVSLKHAPVTRRDGT